MEYPTSETSFLSQKLLLPLFLTSRNRIRINRLCEIKYYIAKKAKSYSSCVEGRLEEHDEFKVIDATGEKKYVSVSNIKSNSPKQSTEKSWKLAPNRYGIPREVGLKKKGMKGAFWSQLKRVPMGKQTRIKTATAFYELPRESEKFKRHCHHFKGKFLTDPRRRKPTTRFMVSNIFTCWRNPKDPGPTQYFIGIFEHQMFKKIKAKTTLPYKFLRYSCVPEKKNEAHTKKTSFDPGPGRYELFDDEDAFRYDLKIADQKRLKFRRLPFKHISPMKHNQTHLWRHISGFGFKRLFRGRPLYPSIVVSKKKTRKVDRDLNLFPSFEYIKMITCPERTPLSIREEPIRKKYRPMRYNCIVKVIIRRQLRNNKKIAFNSGTPRFPDSDMPTARKVGKPPPLVDHPVMRVPVSEIQTKLHAVPHRLRGVFKENRIRPFKFQPFPPIKLLLDDSEVRPESPGSIEIYPRELNPIDFFKEEFKKH